MLEFSTLDFILTSALCYLCGVGTGLSICCKYKETFLQRAKSTEDLSRLNHQQFSPPVMASAPPVNDIMRLEISK